MTVAVLDWQKSDVFIDERDLRIEWYSGTGAGGQHRNKHQNSVRLTHAPTGVVITAQCRSRGASLHQASAELTVRLGERHALAHHVAVSGDRRQQVGTGERADKMRTYRFQDNSVKDHRTGREAQLRAVMSGRFDLLWP